MHRATKTIRDVLDTSDVQDVLRDSFYSERPSTAPEPRKRREVVKAEHYEVICISLYNEDLARLDAKVASLKAAGHRKMNRSALIRFALDTVDASKLPRSY